MKWGAPEMFSWLWLLIPVVWSGFLFLRRRERSLRDLVDAAVLPVLAPFRSGRRVRRRFILWAVGFGFCLLALARPQWGFHWEEVRRRGLDLMVVLDTSRSMLAEDIKPNRLQQAKWGIRDLVQSLRGDRIGLVAFAGSSFLQCPLTSDYAAFLMTLDDVYVGIIPRGGTAIAQALEQAISSFEERTDADRSIVLVTDGEDHEGHVGAVLKQLKEKEIRVYAIGVGTLDGELIPEPGEAGQIGFLKNREGNVIKTALQESALERLARETGGIYVRSAPGDFGLDRILTQGLAQLKKDEHDARMVKIHEDRFVWALALALVLLSAESIMRDTMPGPRSRVS